MLKIAMHPLQHSRPYPRPPATPQEKNALWQLVRRNDARALEDFLADNLLAVNWRLNGHTALETAVTNKNLPCIKMLLRYGANPNTLSDDGKASPLLLAARGNNAQVLITLLHNRAQLHPAQNGEITPVIAAVESNATTTLAILLSHGAPYSTLDGEGQAALHIATQKGHFDAAKLLLDKGENIDQRNAESLTPLMLAAKERNLPAAKFLIENGADENLRCDLRETPLEIARAFANGDTDFLRGFENLIFERYKRAAAGLGPGMHAGTARPIAPQKTVRFNKHGPRP